MPEFIAYVSSAVPVTVLCAMAGRTQTRHSQGNSHKAFEMKLPLRGQQIQLGRKARDNGDLLRAGFLCTILVWLIL